VETIGEIYWVSGPVARVRLTAAPHVMDQVAVGPDHLVGELVSMEGTSGTIQIYENTSGLREGAPVYGTGIPLSAELGPGLIGTVLDGVQRPLEVLAERSGDWITRGATAPALDRARRWGFSPRATIGDPVRPGQIIGTVAETPLVEHRVMIPPDVHGVLTWLAPEGEYTVEEPIARVQTDTGQRTVSLMHRFSIRRPRPTQERLRPTEPLITGQRVIDTLFPIAKGGTAAVPGGFGAGKTVLQHAIAKWSDADVVVYIGCGERGNEMTDVLTEFPKLIDPRSGRPLMERTILIANTSNMPVAAREASIHTGVALAEYYRDMGYHVALMADSTSRWAEALREISARLGEMPAEEGFPAHLASRLASFYERAGLVRTQSGAIGSITMIGAVSPPGGDFSEPVTQHTQRFVRAFWALDKSLAAARHFPAVNCLHSYSGYVDDVRTWWVPRLGDDWPDLRTQTMTILQQEADLLDIVRVVGPDALPDMQRFLLHIARLIKEAFLQQNAMDQTDAYTTPEKQIAILRLLIHAYQRGARIIDLGAPAYRLRDELTVWQRLVRARTDIPNDHLADLDTLRQDLDRQMDAIEKDYRE